MLASLRMRTKRLVMNIIIIAALRARAAKPYHLKIGGYGPVWGSLALAPIMLGYLEVPECICKRLIKLGITVLPLPSIE